MPEALSFRDGTGNPIAEWTAPILRSVDCGPKHGDPPKHADSANGGPSGNCVLTTVTALFAMSPGGKHRFPRADSHYDFSSR